MGSSIVFVVDGTAPRDMAEIVLKLKMKGLSKTSNESNIVKIESDYFLSKFIVHFDEPGTYSAILSQSPLTFQHKVYTRSTSNMRLSMVMVCNGQNRVHLILNTLLQVRKRHLEYEYKRTALS